MKGGNGREGVREAWEAEHAALWGLGIHLLFRNWTYCAQSSLFNYEPALHWTDGWTDVVFCD